MNQARDETENQGRRQASDGWDRLKVLGGLFAVLCLLTWGRNAEHHTEPWLQSIYVIGWTRWWFVALIPLEIGRQLHYVACERSERYARSCSNAVASLKSMFVGDMNDWTRYRVGRAARALIGVAVFACLLGLATGKPPATALMDAPAALWDAMPAIMQILVMVVLVVAQFAALFWFMSKGGIDVYNPGDVKTRFDDVWGQDHVVEKVRENIVFLQSPEEIEARGGYVPGGILLWGPPGTGKTLLAEAVAGETGKPYVFVDPGAFSNMFMGVGILKVKALFRRLRKLALRHGGVVVFFDEADVLGSRGSIGSPNPAPAGMDGCHGANYMRAASAEDEPARLHRDAMMGGFGGDGGTLQALLAELSGLKKPRGFFNRYVRSALGMKPAAPPKYRILTMLATNMPSSLDEALLRPGRIDRMYRVGYPSKAGRIRTYEGYLSKVDHDLTAQQIEKLATITPYATGATIKDVVNEALISAIRNSRSTVTWLDLTQARQLKSLGPSEGVNYIDSERHATAIHEACHAVAAYRQRHHLIIDMATIEKGAGYLGMVSSIPPDDRFTQWRSEYEADVIVALASLAGERAFFGGDHSSGVAGDLQTATRLVAHMEATWAMGSSVASFEVLKSMGVTSGATGDDAMGNRIEKRLEEMLGRAEKLIQDNRRQVMAVAHALETHKTLTGDDVEAIIEGTLGPLVDGAVYEDERFIPAVESYHALCANGFAGPARLPVVADWMGGHRPRFGITGEETFPDRQGV